MSATSTLAERITWLRLSLGLVRREALSASGFGELVGKERRPGAGGYTPSSAKRWEEGSVPDADAINAMVALAARHGLDWVTWSSLYTGAGWPEMPRRVSDPPVRRVAEPSPASPAKKDREDEKLSAEKYSAKKKRKGA